MKRLILCVILIGISTAVPLSAESPLLFNSPTSSYLSIYCQTLLREAYSRIGREFSVTPIPGYSTMEASNEGRFDGELYRIEGIEQTYTNLIPVRVPLFRFSSFVFSKGIMEEINEKEELSAYRVAILRGVVYMQRLVENIPPENITVVENVTQLFRLLGSGRVDLVIAEETDALNAIHNLSLRDVRQASSPITEHEVFHYLHKSHTGLIPGLESVLKELEEEDFIENLQILFRENRLEENPLQP